MRAIDANALIKFIDNRYDITWKDDYEGGIKDACTDILEEINKMPTIEPECTGRWIEYVEDGYVECPFCHSATNCDGNISELHFCFSCGARLEGEG